MGQVAEQVWYNDDRTKGDFFYPFVQAGKEYTIRFVFLREEDKNAEGFVIDYINGDGTIGWFQTDVTAGAGSKGEVRFTSKGTISVDKKYNFKFTQKPTFQNENLLTENGSDWKVEVGLVEGISWDHGAERRTKWYWAVEIPRTELTNTRNLFEMCPSWVPGIDFVCVRPIKFYEHDGKTYKYQWDSFVQDIYYPPKADCLQTININNPAEAARIYGTWEYNTNWTDGDWYEGIKVFSSVDGKETTTLTIDAENCKETWVAVLTKQNGGAFTEEEKAAVADNSCYVFSNDGKTVTRKSEYEVPLSKYFEDYSSDDGSYTEHYELKLFEDYELRVIRSGKNNGENYEYCDTYIKQ